ncbi:MAG: hypothetical protein M3044_06480 [Thermoproteota archaeon]|nr:hypothetical protein [Thermoproteota archaeon]
MVNYKCYNCGALYLGAKPANATILNNSNGQFVAATNGVSNCNFCGSGGDALLPA